ncbi:MAG: sensor histidine kinase [Bacillota bacterium]
MKHMPRFSLNTIRKRMLFYFLMSIILVSSVSVYLSINSNSFFRKIDSMFSASILLEDMKNYLAESEKNLALYIQTKDSDSKNHYQLYADLLNESMTELKGTFLVSDYYNVDKLANLIETFTENAEEAIGAKQGRDANAMRENYNYVHQTSKYIMEEIQQLNLKQLERNTEYYSALSRNNIIVGRANLVMIIDIIVLSCIIILYITYKMTDPIVKLSHSAEEISKGNFDVDEVTVTSEDEIKVMAEAFNKMKSSVRNYIKELQNKSEIESRLMEKEMQNLKMQTLLNDAQLQSLQSQINPHFLFNTLNAGVQLAMMEDADKTSIFLENLAALFRYNVRRLDTAVTLNDEINSVRAYIDLMKVRFGDMILFSVEIDDEELLQVSMPPLILQPIVENSCIHGVGEKEGVGSVSIHVFRDKSEGIIEVADDGAGMDPGLVENIFRKASGSDMLPGKPKKGHTTGIGINNVIQRLRLYFKREDVISIYSVKGEGTKVVIRIPAVGEGKVCTSL